MTSTLPRTVCWLPCWSSTQPRIGLEHLLLTDRSADSVVLAVDGERGPFRLDYRLAWDEAWRLQSADLITSAEGSTETLQLRTDGRGRWRDASGRAIAELDGCLDLDIWPTPFTNSFPIRREPLAVGERREFRMAWIDAITLTCRAQAQAYSRISETCYRFESLDGSGFIADLDVDGEGLVLDYPGLFERVRC
ncbi:MAG: putative glycolipid-binding domain-containing protein [Gammaproteobacteria bacterium]|nr:putative glycolipid-binding domain-containing protein [Gammaproteobacteria bacterium]MBU1442995.1 putative glycolipid-binding domain-containing protein [Gammaproteobacteria bacterium]MBU2285716.1 putative glycolipid-binding domain-containing protein [Gammaproteobacteria bacterium]MBU2408683.1 putative glycolipid-binding domain-containing protein [Gammaproteobacteria bacterium]